MTAQFSVSRPSRGGDGNTNDHAPFGAGRVVSVSPRALASSEAPSRDRRSAMFITPRVIDQSTFDDLAKTLRSLTEQALAVGEKLAEQISQVEDAKASAGRASQDLQERLRLGARMLSAFQSQIGRIEAVIAGLDGQGTARHPALTAEEIVNRVLDTVQRQVDLKMEQASTLLLRETSAMQRSALEMKQQLAQTLRVLAAGIEDAVLTPGYSVDSAALNAGGD